MDDVSSEAARAPIIHGAEGSAHIWRSLSCDPFNTIALETDSPSFNPFTRSLMHGGSLVHLSLPQMDLTFDHEFRDRPIFTSLKSLVVGGLPDKSLLFFSCTPNLVRLEILESYSYKLPPKASEEWNQVLSKIECIKCDYVLHPRLTRNRRVTSLALGLDFYLPAIFTSKYFGSRVPIRKLCIGPYTKVSVLLSFIIDNNSEIEELAILYLEDAYNKCELLIPLLIKRKSKLGKKTIRPSSTSKTGSHNSND